MPFRATSMIGWCVCLQSQSLEEINFDSLRKGGCFFKSIIANICEQKHKDDSLMSLQILRLGLSQNCGCHWPLPWELVANYMQPTLNCVVCLKFFSVKASQVKSQNFKEPDNSRTMTRRRTKSNCQIPSCRILGHLSLSVQSPHLWKFLPSEIKSQTGAQRLSGKVKLWLKHQQKCKY